MFSNHNSIKALLQNRNLNSSTALIKLYNSVKSKMKSKGIEEIMTREELKKLSSSVNLSVDNVSSN